MFMPQTAGGSRSEHRLLSFILLIAIALTLTPVLRLFVEGVTIDDQLNLSLFSEVLMQSQTQLALKHSCHC
jgi:iron(III) transport system permease protein